LPYQTMSFVHLHGHSTFSFLEAIGKPDEIATVAKELDMPAIAITDYNGMHASIKLFQKAKSLKIKAIPWVETGFVLKLDALVRVESIGNICLLAWNQEWYYNLLKIASYANQEWLDNKQKIDPAILQKHPQGIFAIMWGEESRIGKKIINREKDENILETLILLKKILGDENVFLEVIAQDYNILPNTKIINTKILELANKINTKVVIHNNYHYLRADDKDAREMALAIKDGYKMYDEQRRKPKWQYHIMTAIEIKHIMQRNGFEADQIQSRIDTNLQIASQINVDISLYQKLFPNHQTPNNIKELYAKNKDSLVEKT